MAPGIISRNKKLLEAKGTLSRSKDATSSSWHYKGTKDIATTSKTRKKKLLGTKGIATRSKDATWLLALLVGTRSY